MLFEGKDRSHGATLFPYTTLFRSTFGFLRGYGDDPSRPAQPQLAHLRDEREEHRDEEHGEERRGERSEEHTSELQSPVQTVCRLLLEIKNWHMLRTKWKF